MLKSRYSASPCSVKSDRYFGTSALKIRSFCAALNGGSDNIKRPITACCAKRANVMASLFPPSEEREAARDVQARVGWGERSATHRNKRNRQARPTAAATEYSAELTVGS